MKNKKIIIFAAIAISVSMLAACSKDTTKAQDTTNKIEQNQQVKVNVTKAPNISKSDSSSSSKEAAVNNSIQDTSKSNTGTKIEGRREEFLGRLDSIQKQLDVLPEKKASDSGTTIGMRSYYGESYDMYDKALNEIFSLLKDQLSQDTMKNLQAEEIKWIEQKEAAANREAAQYKGGTFELVAYNISLSESTKKRCYELVNNYMTDSKLKINGSKQDYINKLDKIQSKLLLSEEYKNSESGVTNKMLTYTSKEYTEWDSTLNEIYNLLKQHLPSDEMKKLNTEELQWITEKENTAKKAQEPQGAGSQLGNITYQASLAHTTQSRCYELVYRYMK